MREERGAQIGDHALAERHHEIKAHAGGDRQDGDHADEREEIDADDSALRLGKAVIDHPAHGEGHHQRRPGGDHQGDQGAGDPPGIGERIGQKRSQRGHRSARRRYSSGVRVFGHAPAGSCANFALLLYL
jgi:hypothetical protein